MTKKDAGHATRRESILGVAALTAFASVPSQAETKSGVADELAALDATATAAAIRSRKLSALEVIDAALRRSEAMQPKLNFLVTDDYQRARDKAKAGKLTGPFAGVPFLIKDLHEYVGLPTRYGSRLHLKDLSATSQKPFADALDRTGLVVIGTSASPEYGFMPTTEPLAFGPTRNPWNPEHSAGGSSGGAAAATASLVVPFAHASDGGGSIRMPSTNCHVFGLKPSRGRTVSGGEYDTAIGIGAMHCTSRSVRDSAALFAMVEQTGPSATFTPVGFVKEPSRRRLKIGMLTRTYNGSAADPEVATIIQHQGTLLRQLGHDVIDAHWPIDGRFMDDFLLYWAAAAAGLVQHVTQTIGRKPDETMLEPFTLGMAEWVARQEPGALEVATARLMQSIETYAVWMKDYDVVLSPVLRTPAARLGYLGPDVPFDTMVTRLIDYVGYTPLHNVAGAPAMSIPAALTKSGLPVGAHYGAAAGGERVLFELAYELEQASPWCGHVAPIHA